MLPADRVATLSRRVGRIVNSDGFGLQHLEESLNSAMRRGAIISPSTKDLAMEAATRILDGRALAPVHEAVLEGIVLGNGLRPAFDIEAIGASGVVTYPQFGKAVEASPAKG